MTLKAKPIFLSFWKTVKHYGAKLQNADALPRSKLKKRHGRKHSSAIVVQKHDPLLFTTSNPFPGQGQHSQDDVFICARKPSIGSSGEKPTPGQQFDAGFANSDSIYNIALQRVQQLSGASSQTETNAAFFVSESEAIEQIRAESTGNRTQTESVPGEVSFHEAQGSQMINESEWLSNKSLSPPKRQPRYTQEDVNIMIREYEDQAAALKSDNIRLKNHIFSTTLERDYAVEDAQNTAVEVSQLRFEIRAARTQIELDSIVLQDAICGEQKERVVKAAEECSQVYMRVVQEHETLCLINQNLNEQVDRLQALNSHLFQLNEDLKTRSNPTEDHQTFLEQEKKSLEAEESMNNKNVDMVTSLQDQIRRIEQHVEFVLADHAQKYLQQARTSKEERIFLLAPNEEKSLKQALKHLQKELKEEQDAKEKLQQIIRQQKASLSYKDQEIEDLNTRAAILSTTSNGSDSSTTQFLKLELIEAKLANAKLQITNSKQCEVYEAKISSQGPELDQLKDKVIAAELEVFSMQEQLQEKEAYVAETDNLRSQLRSRAFGNDLDFLYSEQKCRIQRLEDICNFYFSLANDLDAEIRLLKQEAGYKVDLLEDLEDRYRVKNLEHIREKMCRLGLEWRFREDICASGRKIELDFTENELEARAGDVDVLKDVDYELYQPNTDVFVREQDDASFAMESNWEKHVREQREQEALKAFHKAVANAEAIAAYGHEIFKVPTPEKDFLRLETV